MYIKSNLSNKLNSLGNGINRVSSKTTSLHSFNKKTAKSHDQKVKARRINNHNENLFQRNFTTEKIKP